MKHDPLPDVRRGDLWRFVGHDRLRQARFEETRQVLDLAADRIVCELASSDPVFAGGRRVHARMESAVTTRSPCSR